MGDTGDTENTVRTLRGLCPQCPPLHVPSISPVPDVPPPSLMSPRCHHHPTPGRGNTEGMLGTLGTLGGTHWGHVGDISGSLTRSGSSGGKISLWKKRAGSVGEGWGHPKRGDPGVWGHPSPTPGGHTQVSRATLPSPPGPLPHLALHHVPLEVTGLVGDPEDADGEGQVDQHLGTGDAVTPPPRALSPRSPGG